MADVLRGLENEIINLHSYDISTCMQLYDRLYAHENNLTGTDAKMIKLLQRIMTAKAELTNVSSLTAETCKVKRERLHPLILNYTSEQDSDHLWKFLRSTDIQTEKEKNSLGFTWKLYAEWARKNRINENISDVDNVVAKCICRLDHFLKDFVFLSPLENDMKAVDVAVKPHLNALLELLLLQKN